MKHFFIILADIPLLLPRLHCFVIDQPATKNSPPICQHSNSHFTAETRVLLLLQYIQLGTILSFDTVGPRQWLTEWPQSDWLPTLRPKIRELGSKDDKSKWADVAVWWWWWRLMCLEAAYEISISVSWRRMLSPSTTCSNTIKKYYEKLKDATGERKK